MLFVKKFNHMGIDMTQPEALRLADLLEQIDGQHWQVQDSAAAELRRLHAERTAADGVINDLVAKVRGLQTQRKPLTEEEIDSIWDSEKAFADIYAIVRAIERAHGITP